MKRIYDLTLGIYNGALPYPGDPETDISTVTDIENEGFNVSRITMSSHLGTHIDAPRHYNSEAAGVDKILPQKLIGTAYLLDFSSKTASGIITLDEIHKYENEIKSNSILVMRTGWDKFYASEKYFTDYPSVSPDACDFIADCGVTCIACDMPGISSHEIDKTHKLLLGRGIILVESLCGLEKIEKNKFLFIALPLKIIGADGSPCRAVGVGGLSEEEMKVFDFRFSDE